MKWKLVLLCVVLSGASLLAASSLTGDAGVGAHRTRAAAAPAAPAALRADLADFAWLAGRWEGTVGKGMHADITYTDARGGSIFGMMRLRNAAGDSLVMGEIILISGRGSDVVMRAHHFTPELRIWSDTAMTLRYTGGSPDSLHFVNVNGTKPRDAIYLRRGPDEHLARSIIVHDSGREQIIEATYRRAK